MLDLCRPTLPFRPPLAARTTVPAESPERAADSPLDANLAAHLAKGQRRDADTIWRRNPREQGLIGLTDAVAWFGRQGWSISLPLIDSQPYDLIVDDGERLQRVQVKTTTYRSPYGVFVVSLATRGGNQSFHTAKAFDRSSCELLYVLTDAGDRYLIPTSVIRSANTLSLGRRYDEHRLRS
ncbi:group I intron-associated PD-(D/E)XK endonuclease [Nitriliruptor alkaliphilus]|uniref:group I intron-associated PD-(D/E)XK endonuclease n=1 Tax=Nitriliruptor alkaliphilus TaxID=427918 RepID=UPI000697B34D|nr:group I intron-associated PD-(D/E)XK endonuclease [Nitriliruptor alkaliphilus]